MEYCKGHEGYGVDNHGNCVFCGLPRQTSTDSISPRWITPEEQKPEWSNEERKILRRRAFELFNTSQCSWCKLFYTQPFLCVPGVLHSNCSFFKELSKEDREKTQAEQREWSWSWRAYDMVLRVQAHGILARCRKCGSLNPNPDKYTCWHCGEDLSCPDHKGSVLRYDTVSDFWKHPNTACRKTYTWCKLCGQATLLQTPEGIWECTNCHAHGTSPEIVEKLNFESLFETKPIGSHQNTNSAESLQKTSKDDKSNTQEDHSEVASFSADYSDTTLHQTVCNTCVKRDSLACPYGNQPSIKINDGRGVRRDVICDSYSGSVAGVKRPEPPPIKEDPVIQTGKWQGPPRKKSGGGCWIVFLAILFVGLIIGILIYSSHHSNQNAISNPETTTSESVVAPITMATTIIGSANTSKVTTTSVRINSYTGTYKNYYLGLVSAPDGNLIGGDGCYDDQGDFIVLINNKNATNPTYDQMVNFLQNDTTDEYPYLNASIFPGSYYPPAENDVDLTRIKNIIDGTAQPSNPRVCSDFSERLHNDAEMAGIRCAYVSIDLSTGGHAIDAFQTTDRGLIYIDDTGPSQEPHALRAVKTVNLSEGSEFIPVSLFPESGWDATYDSTGTVIDFKVIWDGTWNN